MADMFKEIEEYAIDDQLLGASMKVADPVGGNKLSQKLASRKKPSERQADRDKATAASAKLAARNAITPLSDPNSKRSSGRKQSARRRGASGRASTILSNRETLS